MDDQKDRNKAYLTMVLWIVLIVFDVVSVPLLLLWGKLNTSTLIASVVLSVFVISIGIYAVVRTYKDHIKPARLDEKTGETTYEKRVEKIHKRRSGKDMFEVCDNFRKRSRRKKLSEFYLCINNIRDIPQDVFGNFLNESAFFCRQIQSP